MSPSMFVRPYVLICAVLLALSACGDDDNGDGDTLFTGLSGVIIVAVVVWLIVRSRRNRT